MPAITASLEDYLETIRLLERREEKVRVTDIASELGVAKPSVHAALHALADRGLITHEPYRAITLTAEGRRESEAIYARHAALRRFFEEVVGVNGATAERDACAVEHVLSPESMGAIIEMTERKRDDNQSHSI